MTSFTVVDRNGSVLGRNLTCTEAMHEILTDDGYDYQIIKDRDGGFSLWTSRGSRNSFSGAAGMIPTVIYSIEEDEQMARIDIAMKVINARWDGNPEAITDEAWDKMQAELAAE